MTNDAGITLTSLGTALMKPFHYPVSAIGPRTIGTHSPGLPGRYLFHNTRLNHSA